MQKQKSIASEILPESIRLNGRDYPIKRLPLRKIFRFVNLVQDYLGEIVESIRGTLPPEVLAEIKEADKDEAKINAIVAAHLATVDDSVTGIMKKLLSKENLFYEIVALCLDPQSTKDGQDTIDAQIEFVADNVFLGDAVKIVVTVIRAELTEDFFGDIQEGAKVLRQAGLIGTDTSETESNPTAFNGSGSSSPSLEDDGPILVTQKPS